GSRGKLAEAAVATTTGLVRSGISVKRIGPVCAVADKQLLSKTPHAKTSRFFTGELCATCLPSRSGRVAVPEAKRKGLKRHGLLEHSRRILPTRRSQKAFAWGTWNGVFKTLKPIDFRVESNSQE